MARCPDLAALELPALHQLRTLYPEGSPCHAAISARLAALVARPRGKGRTSSTRQPSAGAGPRGRVDELGEEARKLVHREVTTTAPIRLVIAGAPRTKKTSNSIEWRDGKPKVIPSEAWMRWRDAAVPQLAGVALPDAAYNCAAYFYRDRRSGDAVGYYQGLADVLQEAGVVSNDRLIETWDGSRLRADRANPRVELILTLAEEDSCSP